MQRTQIQVATKASDAAAKDATQAQPFHMDPATGYGAHKRCVLTFNVARQRIEVVIDDNEENEDFPWPGLHEVLAVCRHPANRVHPLYTRLSPLMVMDKPHTPSGQGVVLHRKVWVINTVPFARHVH